MGTYGLGFVDGGIAVAVILVAVFYIASFSEDYSTKIGESPKREVKLTKKIPERKVDSDFIKELIKRCEKTRSIVVGVHNRIGNHFLRVELNPSEEADYKEQMEWIQRNYPKVAGELSRATRMTRIDPVLGIKVNNYDPLLQTLNFSALKRVFKNSFELEQFEENFNGLTRLRAYLGTIS